MLPASSKKSPINRTRTFIAQLKLGASPISDSGFSYSQLSSETALHVNGQYACCGGARELILLNMASDALMQIYLQCFPTQEEELVATQRLDDEGEVLSQLSVSAKEAAIVPVNAEAVFNLSHPLAVLQHIVRFVVRTFSTQHDAATIEKLIVEQVRERNQGPTIPLENLVQGRLGLCRHRALLVGYLLTQWLHQANPNSTASVYRFRTGLIKIRTASSSIFNQSVPHAVTLYRDEENHFYLLDATRCALGAEQGLAIKLTDISEEGMNLLRRCYPGYDIENFVKQIDERYQQPVQETVLDGPQY